MITKLINIDDSLKIPKYKQIINSVFYAIEKKYILKGDQIPSINEISKLYNLSRDTVMTAFNELKAKGIIKSVPGKGYYINSTEIRREENIFLLFDELNAFKEILYNSFVENIKGRATVDIYFHYFNKRIFKNLINENIEKYTTFIIMPVGFNGIADAVNRIKNGKTYILDQANPELISKYPAIYQNFEKDIFNSLSSGETLLTKYKTLIMIYPGGKEPKGQLNGFVKFCKKKNFDYKIIQNPKERKIRKGDVYVIPNDIDLVNIIKKTRELNYAIGKDIGIISYNDTPLKEVVGDGITTISTDFKLMGKTLAEMVLNNIDKKIENPSSLIIRKSL